MSFFGRYSQDEMDKALQKAYKKGWVEGQENGIHLQPEFTELFFNKAYMNKTTKCWEITKESYAQLKMQLMKENANE